MYRWRKHFRDKGMGTELSSSQEITIVLPGWKEVRVDLANLRWYAEVSMNILKLLNTDFWQFEIKFLLVISPINLMEIYFIKSFKLQRYMCMDL